jgi:LytS/YehU family sensor histidine kinase
MKVKVRSTFDRQRVQFATSGESATHQSHKEACDIHNMIRKYDNTGLLPDGRPPGSYVDCINMSGKAREQLILDARAKSEGLAKQFQDQIDAAEVEKQEKLAADAEELKRLREKEASAKDNQGE